MSKATDSSEKSSNLRNSEIWNELIQWIDDNGGAVHPALVLDGHSTEGAKPRGIFAAQDIAKGETLIKLPKTCVISGDKLDVEKSESASCWLKCVGAYYRCLNTGNKTWQPYFKSLPKTYETLFQWTDGEVNNFLAGTALRELVIADRSENSLAKRYVKSVRPFLQEQKVGLDDWREHDYSKISNEELDLFKQACQCISTRGFHLNFDIDDGSAGSNYPGPFLLPVVDLLNHNPSKKCTTLQRDSTSGLFFMIAERDIKDGEEIYHSYGDDLTAAQLLQTFGFVPTRESFDAASIKMSSATPVILHKHNHLLAACAQVKKSNIVQKMKDLVVRVGSTEDEVWDVSSIQDRSLHEKDAPLNWLISNEDNNLISDELITFLVCQFLPVDAYQEIIDGDGRLCCWLDKSVLDDLYLGQLVCMSLLKAIKLKEADYASIQINSIQDENTSRNESQILKDTHLATMLSKKDCNTSENRALHGISVRIEELASLKRLKTAVESLQTCMLSGEAFDAGQEESYTKRRKME